MPLAQVPAGNLVRIDSFDLAPQLALRCRSLGLVSGADIEVLDNRRPCPLVVSALGARIMIGRELASRLVVSPKASEERA